MRIPVGRPIFGGRFAIDDGAPVPYVLPGEEIAFPPPLPHTLTPALPTVLTPSPERVEARCRHFGACGGCAYQHAPDAVQLGWKAAILSDLFAEAGIVAPRTFPTDAAEPWGYRNRIRLRVQTGVRAGGEADCTADPGTNCPDAGKADGELSSASAGEPALAAGGQFGRETGSLAFGYSLRGTHHFLPITMCPIAAPALWDAVETLRRLSVSDAALARLLRATAEIELFTTRDERELQITFSLRTPETTRGEPGLFSAVCARLEAALPSLRGAGATLAESLGRRARRGWTDLAWGAPGLRYRVGEDTFWVSRGAFFQANRFLLESLVERVVKNARGALAWDLFAGAGLFSRPLARRFGRVVAVEGGDAAARDLAVAGRGARGEPPFEAVHAPILDFLRDRQTARERPDLIVLDPPRTGLGRETATLLARVRAPAIVCVSCDPTSLMRDLAILLDAGYNLEEIRLLDLFPQTAHMETVVHLHLSAAPGAPVV